MTKPVYHVVANLTSGHGRGRRCWEQLRPALTAAGLQWTLYETKGPGDGRGQGLAAAAAACDGDVVVALGGDGTAGEVADGLIASGRAATLPLGLVSAGTGNDLARTLGLPRDPRAALQVIAAGRSRRLDAGRAGDQHFLNVAGFGFDAAVANAANEGPKFLGGTVPYVLGLLRTLWQYRPAPLRLTLDGETLAGRFLFVAVANGRYFGGGMQVAPGADMADGALDIILAGDLQRGETLRMLPTIYQGAHIHHPKVKVVRARRLQVETGSLVHCQADGELLQAVPAEFSVVSAAVSMLVP